MKTFLVMAMFAFGVIPCCAQSGCTVSKLKGGYGFTSYQIGSYKDKNGMNHNGYVRSIGVFYYSGDGKVHVNGNAIGADSQIVNMSLDGSYTMSGNCTGEIKLENPNGSESTLTFVVVSGGSEIETITYASNGEIPFLQRKQ